MKKSEKEISISLVQKLVKEYYGIKGNATKLNGELDLNFKISANNSQYYLKVYNHGTDIKFAKFQEKILNKLNKTSEKKVYPKQLLNKNGDAISFFYDESDEKRFFRLNSWIEGRLWSEANPITNTLRKKLGRTAGKLTKSLKSLKTIDCNYNTDWDLAKSLWTVNYLKSFKNKKK